MEAPAAAPAAATSYSPTSNVQFAQLRDEDADARPPLLAFPPANINNEVNGKCTQRSYIGKRFESIIITGGGGVMRIMPKTSLPPPLPCTGCGEAPCQQPRLRSVSNLPAAAQNTLRSQLALFLGGFLAFVAVTSVLTTRLLTSWSIPGDQYAVWCYLAVLVLMVTIVISDQSFRSLYSWLLFILFGVTHSGITAGIDSVTNSCSLVVICCALSFVFLVVAAYIKRAASSHQAAFTLDKALPVSPVKASAVAYLFTAIVQITIYYVSRETTFVTRNGLIGCLLAELGLVVYLLWDLSQMWRFMRKEEMPRVLGFLHADLLMLYIAVFTFISTLPLFPCLCALFYCIGASSESDKDGDVEMNREAIAAATTRSGDAAAMAEKKKQQLLGDRVYQDKQATQ